MSLRARLLAASLALVAFGLLAANVATYSALRSFLYGRVDTQLAAATRSAERSILELGGPSGAESLRQLGAVVPGVYVEVWAAGRTDTPIVKFDRRGSDGSPTAPRLPADLSSLLAEPNEPGAQTNRLLTVPSLEPGGPHYRVEVSSLPGANILVVALPLRETTETLHRLLIIEVLVSAIVLAVAAVIGTVLVRLGLRPLADIQTTAAEITAGDLSQRVERQDDTTEVGRLGRTLNVMLETLDVAFAERQASEEAARESEEAARESEQRVRRFVADASHELRTPLAAVRAYAELYRRGAQQHPDDLARLLARIEEEAARMGVLVDDLLLLTRLDEGRPLERAPVDLGAVAADSATAARALEPDRPIGLEVIGSVEVVGDRDRLRQVVDNLLANVRAHTPQGAPADVRVFAENGHALVEVADRGPGLAGGDVDQVFERFYRVDSSRSRDRGGSGLGLSIVAAIATAHDGRATADDREGGGAVFRVQLPLLDAATS